MTDLIICEKPNVAKKIANALGNPKKKSDNGVPYYELERNGKKIIVASAVGHLFTLEEVKTDKKKKFGEYPVFDIRWTPASTIKGKEYVQKYINTLKKLAKEADEFYIASDWDIEGELIGYHALYYCCGKKDAKRMRFSSLTKNEIVKAYENPDKIDFGLVDAGDSRHKVDWYYGINVSRALMQSIRAVNRWQTMSTGRVQGPALSFLVDRELEIRKFVPKPYWVIGALLKDELTAVHEKDKFWDEKEANEIYNKIKDEKEAVVSSVKKTKKKIKPNPPFDLGTLQREAHRAFRFSPKKTQEIAQKLYEQGLCLHPDTLVALPNGIKKIKDLDEKGEVLCLDDNLKLTKSRYKLLKRTVKEKLIKITLNDGTELITTKEHPVLVYRDGLIFVPSEELKENEQTIMFINISEKRFNSRRNSRRDELQKVKELSIRDYKKYSHHYSIIYANWENKFKSGIIQKFNLSNQVSKNKGLSLNKLRELSEYLTDNDLKRISKGDVYISKIKEIKEIEYEGEVYDLTVETYHNFIANGVIVHNCSYPRTSSQKLPKDENYIKDILTKISKHEDYKKYAELILNENRKPIEGKKSDPAHPAIHFVDIPKEPLADDEKKLYDLIVRRTLATFWDDAEREYINVVLNIGGENFKLSGSRTVKEGWHEIYYFTKFDEKELPSLRKNSKIPVEKITIERKETKPPKRYTMASIIKELENRQLGTKCLTSDTLIKVKINDKIENLKIGELFEMLNEKFCKNNVEFATNNNKIRCISYNENGNIVESEFEFISRRKLCDNERVYKIEFNDGSYIEATDEHPILIYDNKEHIKYVRTKDLDKGMKCIYLIKYSDKEGKIFCNWDEFVEFYKYIGEKVINKDFITKTISNITKTNYNGYVYDIVNSKYSNFIANGIVVHNSTRADIVEKLVKRGYLIDDGSLKVTDLGIAVIETLKKYCPEIIDEQMTRELEKKLDRLQKRTIKKETVLKDAENKLRKILEEVKKKEKEIGKELVEKIDATNKSLKTVGKCKCGGDLIIIRTKGKKRFIGCTNYPECTITYPLPQKGRIKVLNETCEICGAPVISIDKQKVCINPECPSKISSEEKKEMEKAEKVEKTCPKCGGKLIIKKGIYGVFLGCENYPKCRYTEKLNGKNEAEKPEKVIVGKCPDCGGDLIIRKGRFGEFIGCSNYPKCRHTEKIKKNDDNKEKKGKKEKEENKK